MEHRTAGLKQCKSKKKFNKKEDADLRCKEIYIESGNVLRPYFCTICSNYHLTSKTKEQSKESRRNIEKQQEKYDRHYENQIKSEIDYWTKKKGW